CSLSLTPPHPPPSTLFPYTTLFRSHSYERSSRAVHRARAAVCRRWSARPYTPCDSPVGEKNPTPTPTNTMSFTTAGPDVIWPPRDRKSTRLNSSHLVISYAVFCLKK